MARGVENLGTLVAAQQLPPPGPARGARASIGVVRRRGAPVSSQGADGVRSVRLAPLAPGAAGRTGLWGFGVCALKRGPGFAPLGLVARAVGEAGSLVGLNLSAADGDEKQLWNMSDR